MMFDSNYFAGVLYCGVCSSKLSVYDNAYKCMGRFEQTCNAKAITTKELEKVFINYFMSIPGAEQSETAAEIKRATGALLEALQEKISILEDKRKEILDSYILDKITLTEFQNVQQRINSEKDRINKEMDLLTPTDERRHRENFPSKEDIISIFKSGWYGYTDIDKLQFVERYIKRITAINEQIPGNKQGIYKILNVEYKTN